MWYRIAYILLAFLLFLTALLGYMIGRDKGFAAAREIYDVRPEQTHTNPGPYPHETAPRGSQRTWADLFAACRLVDGWLGSTVEGEPVCYPMDQSARLGSAGGGR